MATKFIAHYEVFRAYSRGISRWEDKEFSTYEDAEYYCAKMRKKYDLGAYVKVVEDKPKYDPDAERAYNTVSRLCDRAFSGGGGFF